jgi:hypothetical protein
MPDLSELIERIEAASGPCVGLDADIEHATGRWSDHHFEAWVRWQECGEAMNPPMSSVPASPNRYTASLDAAITLVPEGWNWLISKESNELALASIAAANSAVETMTTAATPALALCGAALKAHQTKG